MDTWRDQGEEEEAVLLVHEVSVYGVDKLRSGGICSCSIECFGICSSPSSCSNSDAFCASFSGFYDNYYGYTTTPEEQEDEELAELINPREGFSEPIAMPVIYSPGVTAADVYGLNRGGGYRRKRSNKRVKNFR